MDTDFTGNNRLVLFNGILDRRPEIRIAGEAFWLTGNVNTTNLVVDRSITLALALIVPDEVFERMTDGQLCRLSQRGAFSRQAERAEPTWGGFRNQRQAYPHRHSL